MKQKHLIALSMAMILLVTLFGIVSADSEDPTPTPTEMVGSLPTATPTEVVGSLPTATPTVVPTSGTSLPGSKFFTHPIVKLLDSYFGKSTLPTVPSETPTPDPLVTPDPLATPTPVGSGSGLSQVGEEIAAYHEAGMGFGQLVKIYAMVKASEDACASQQPVESPTEVVGSLPVEPEPVDGTCVPLTVEELVAQVQSGVGMGQLFEEYGRPAMLGVGHVRQETKKQTETTPETNDETSTETTNDEQTGNGNGQGRPENGQDKQENGQGRSENGQDRQDNGQGRPDDGQDRQDDEDDNDKDKGKPEDKNADSAKDKQQDKGKPAKDKRNK
jgi:hypothetical protein